MYVILKPVCTPFMNINISVLTSILHMLPNDVVNVNKMFIYDTGKYVCAEE